MSVNWVFPPHKKLCCLYLYAEHYREELEKLQVSVQRSILTIIIVFFCVGMILLNFIINIDYININKALEIKGIWLIFNMHAINWKFKCRCCFVLFKKKLK